MPKEEMTISKDETGTLKTPVKYRPPYTCLGKLSYSVKVREEFDPILDDIKKGENVAQHKHRIEKHFAEFLPWRLSEVSERLEALNNIEFYDTVFRLKFKRDGCNNDNSDLIYALIDKGIHGEYVVECPACGNKTDIGIGDKPAKEKKVLDKDWAK